MNATAPRWSSGGGGYCSYEEVCYARTCGATWTTVRCRRWPLKPTKVFWRNFTTPGAVANSVSSLPRETFVPARYAVPRCRMMMPPALMVSPSATFTPSRCPWESRPRAVDPPAFLCAIERDSSSKLQTTSSSRDRQIVQDRCLGVVVAAHRPMWVRWDIRCAVLKRSIARGTL